MMRSLNGNIFRVIGPFCGRIHRSPVNSPHKGQWRRAFHVFFDLRPYKRLNKHSRDWWFETPSRPLWRHCNCPLMIYPFEATFLHLIYKLTKVSAKEICILNHIGAWCRIHASVSLVIIGLGPSHYPSQWQLLAKFHLGNIVTLTKKYTFLKNELHLKMSSAKCRPSFMHRYMRPSEL